MSGRLLPAHPKPLPDELLSSWIVRVAEANAVKLHTLTRINLRQFPNPWNRDIDRQGPPWLLRRFASLTGVSRLALLKTTLHGFAGHVFPRILLCGQLRWLLPVKTRSSHRYGYGLQYCPQCLASDLQPYFRRRWRLGFYTFCPDHNVMLLDACASCGAPVAIHRRDYGREIDKAIGVTVCNKCGYDLRSSPAEKPVIFDERVFREYSRLLKSMRWNGVRSGHENMEYFSILHQLCKIFVTVKNRGCLEEHVCRKLGIPRRIAERGRFPFEQRRIAERYFVISLALWIMEAFEERLGEAWGKKAVRFNLLLKDFRDPPEWFDRMVRRFNRRRLLLSTITVTNDSSPS